MNPYRVDPPKFEGRFLLPQFWPTWLMVGFLYLLSWLPFSLQLQLGKGLGRLFKKSMKKRVLIAKKNLQLSFPGKSEDEIDKIIDQVYNNTGIAMLETGIAWWWPDWRLKRKVKVEGLELVKKATDEGKGVFALLFHFLSLEVHARAVGFYHPAVGLYRPHNNPLMEYLQTKGRGRSNKYLLGKKNVKGFLQALEDGELCGYLPDQDYGPNRAVYIPLFAVPDAATTTGSSIFANHPNAVTLISTFDRLPGNQGYVLRFYEPENAIPTGNDEQDARHINSEVEKAVENNIGAYMWMHRRYKTRPSKDLPSYYGSLQKRKKQRKK
ncbi:LpxL/LpxP family Kdo(2)-lipid IV(A) lauroyl/palmitoleoyl acyltransferase [Aliidiomarina sp. B3213]|uniref:LpxL/LpxP family Kdo(2)-lipid IV(A) lauroyl/palmitoleoyl acyltransferase n=1 Tax=Aliidiomarina sp. B3213 TaxID=2249757 RepID=UPI000DD0EC28|nr:MULTISPECIES: LpxL/LpxP family Kdo(2)-lipid IV(A) lauroyl/palmitoleoyl acyltransferase [Gammaproteobacteria]RTE87694.1 LpxL/LpxP family Kdo(2)-lipid IV(A) lauroyl/palmitoleoyl acyltransferase [Aliidiomarina sp. B3213]TCZ93404.1 LpxL/LpxP family Kdo(2)-lipid IV(A) lauroyl/palmitoleoyl acyltransferase [Lysobacter sp. N42]